MNPSWLLTRRQRELEIPSALLRKSGILSINLPRKDQHRTEDIGEQKMFEARFARVVATSSSDRICANNILLASTTFSMAGSSLGEMLSE